MALRHTQVVDGRATARQQASKSGVAGVVRSSSHGLARSRELAAIPQLATPLRALTDAAPASKARTATITRARDTDEIGLKARGSSWGDQQQGFRGCWGPDMLPVHRPSLAQQQSFRAVPSSPPCCNVFFFDVQLDHTGEVPFKRILCANRGEIAIRVFRAGTELGLRTVSNNRGRGVA